MMLFRARDNNVQSFAHIWLYKGNQNEFLKHPKIKWLDGGLEPPTSGLPVQFLVRAAQVVEQWTGNPEVGGSSPPSNHLIFGCLRNSF